ncbi:MAG TPA: dihydroorotase [Steroidobacteraceae bacterium]|nr:dihydroorotase [Steroidobacteraceae bacterium]
MTTLAISRPDDLHVHLRDGAALAAVAHFTAQRFGRALVMPNLRSPVTTTELARAYRGRILAALPAGSRFEPLMTLYLTEATEPAEIERAKDSGLVRAVKLYPAGATTHSRSGVAVMERVYPVLARMQELGMPLSVHAETPGDDIDPFDREAHFIDSVLAPLAERFATLKIVVEHITTRHAAAFVSRARAGVAATITPHHLLHNRGALFSGGIRPHYFCLPVLKREDDRLALIEAATGGNPRFFLGTDSAPHERAAKEAACGCAGMFTAHAGIELYAEVFAAAGRLHRLDAFAGRFGADFYGLPRQRETITLAAVPWDVPPHYPFGAGALVPYRAGEPVLWRLAERERP